MNTLPTWTWQPSGGYQYRGAPAPPSPEKVKKRGRVRFGCSRPQASSNIPPTPATMMYPSLNPWFLTPVPPGSSFFWAPPLAPGGNSWPFPPLPQPESPMRPYGSWQIPPRAPRKTAKPKENPWQPVHLDSGVSYLFDKHQNHTLIHVFNKAAPVWEERYETENLEYKAFKVSTNFTVKMVIENVLKRSEEACKEWAVTEVYELGGGRWTKGLTVEYEKASGTLKSMGWSARRGGRLPPIWLVVHRKGL